jgi:hypothetical protein
MNGGKMIGIGMKQQGWLREGFVAAVFVLAVPSIALAVDDTCVPALNTALPARSIQLRVHVNDPNEPTPIIIDLQSFGISLGAVQAVALPEAPDTAGSAVIDGGSLVIRTVSPYVEISDPNAETIAVPDQAPVGTTASLLLDPATSSGLDPDGNPCVVPIADVLPGGGLLPDVSFLGATDLGKSATPLLAATEAIFPVQTRSSAVFAPPASGTFFGLALQNPDPADSIVSVELWDTGSVVASASLALPSRTKVSRDVSELFPGVIPGSESFFQVTATVPVQMLGLSGNETDGSVAPVLPTLATP